MHSKILKTNKDSLLNKKPRGYWTREKVFAEGKKYPNRRTWQLSQSRSYNIAWTNGWLDQIIGREIVHGTWTKEAVLANGVLYPTKTAWRNSKDGSAYVIAKRNGWISELKHFERELSFGERTIYKWLLSRGIEHECEKILMLKLKNYHEFMMLDEYRAIITLLKKGIAIHHAGILCILREMVELLFEKRYIKLLFATETFAVGINMPTKTVIFTQLSKYCDNTVRELLSYEYTQMAGRAGRRGIDTIGHVIHCNNLFKMPNINNYKTILTGPPKVLISQFKISYNLIFNIIVANEDSEQQQIADKLICFMKKSFVQNDIIKEINFYDKQDKELDNKLNICQENLNNNSICKTSIDILKKYNELTRTITKLNNKQKKQLQKIINNIEYENHTIKHDIDYLITYDNLLKEKIKNEEFKTTAMSSIQNNINNIIKILNKNGFLESEYILTTKGQMALSVQEIHSLVLCDLYEKYNGFEDLSAKELTGLLSCFTNISVPSDIRLSIPGDTHINSKVKECAKYIGFLIDKYYNIEIEYQLNTGADYDIHYELIDYIIEWCDCENENKCVNLINQFKTEKSLFLGEFIKAIIKINNIVKELEKICDINNNISLLQKIKKIPELTLKYVVTNQSLYI
jgi:superfamily II RNA helicase